MQRRTGGTPFTLKSGSPFQQTTRMVRRTDDNKNELVDVTKGKTSTRKTFKQAWADNDEGIQGKYSSYNDYVADRTGQQTANPEAYEADLVSKTGVSGGPGSVQTPDTVTAVPSPGEKIDEVKGDMKDTFTPQDIRMADRERKIISNRTSKADRKIRNKTSRYDKALGKAGYNSNMVQPSEMTIDAEGKEIPNIKYKEQMQAFNNNEAIKNTFDKTRKGGRLKDKIASAQGDKDFYAEHTQRIQEGADQGVNPNKGRMIEEGKQMKAHQPESMTEGSDRTFVDDDHGLDVYEGQEELQTNTGGGNTVNLNTADQSGGDSSNERGSIETITGSDLTPENQRVQANLQRKAGSTILKNMPGGSITHGIVKGIMGSGEHKSDFEGDRDSFLEPTWWDGAKNKMSNFFSGISNASKSNEQVNSEVNNPKVVKNESGDPTGEDDNLNKFGGPKMKFKRTKKY
jgi:hypothetical protein